MSGRLAASINHPNSVYIFGTEEVGGTPVITMELVSGGTLQDRVRARGTLPAGEAVDCVLQIVEGLEGGPQMGIQGDRPAADPPALNAPAAFEAAASQGDFSIARNR